MARAGLGRLLLSSLPAYRLRLGGLVVLQAVQAIALLLLPTINGAMIDHGVLARDVGYIKVSGSVMVAVTVVQVCALLGAIRLATFVGVAVARDLRERVFTGVLRFAPQTVAEYGVPGLTARTVNDVQQLQAFLITALSTLVVAQIVGGGAVARWRWRWPRTFRSPSC